MGANWFLALPLPPQARWQDVALTAPPELRRFAAEDLHLTLAFLGPCDEALAMAAWEAVAELQAEPIRISAAGWRGLGPPQQPSAYGLTLAEGHPQLSELLLRWGPQALAAAGLSPPRRSPLPHVTLLRPRRREASQWCEPMRAWMAAAPLPSGTVLLRELALYTWDRERHQRLFRITARRPLAQRS